MGRSLNEIWTNFPANVVNASCLKPSASACSEILGWMILCSPCVGILNPRQRQPCRHASYSAGRRL